MDKKNEEFLKRLINTFKVEAQEHINNLSSGLINLEKATDAGNQQEIIEAVFREAHSLKGAARTVDMADIERLCQSLEDIFAALKNRKITVSAELLDLLHEAVDGLKDILITAEGSPDSRGKAAVTGLVQRLGEAAAEDKADVQEPAIAAPVPPETETAVPETDIESPARDIDPQSITIPDTVRVSMTRLTPVLARAEELLLAKLASEQRVTELSELDDIIEAWQKEWGKIRPELQNLRYAQEKKEGHGNNNGREQGKLLDFIDWCQVQAGQMETRLAIARQAAEFDSHSVGLMVDGLLEDTKRVMMVSFSTLLEAFPRMVRNISRNCGREVRLVIQGGEVEIDRRILEDMKDPLIHLVRNSIEHGIETPEQRRQRNKPDKGTVTLAIAQRDNHIEILISDNGGGIDIDKVKTTAVNKGVISEKEAESISDEDILSLVFLSGVSTSPFITDISGRGLGLAIVREKVNKVGGIVSLETHPGEGTAFKLVLPMTEAALRGIIVRAGEHYFVMTTAANVDRVMKVRREEIKTVENRQTIELEGKAVSLERLADALGINYREPENDAETSLEAVVLHADDQRLAFLVDEVIGEQEILIKNLGKQLLRVPNIAGATILGTGRLVPVLNTGDLMTSTVRAGTIAGRQAAAPAEEREEGRKPSVLVVEDSVTARTLLKNIMEVAGYNISTAVDGLDAFTKLRGGEFDIVVSDVDMPRMNGFDLTAKIRADKKLSDIPVVLLTALDSREHRERGMEAGASAYIVKSGFDQSNLLEVIRRLI